MTIAANLLNAASDAYDDSALGFRDYFGRKTVEKLNIREGARVLDVCCGTGLIGELNHCDFGNYFALFLVR